MAEPNKDDLRLKIQNEINKLAGDEKMSRQQTLNILNKTVNTTLQQYKDLLNDIKRQYDDISSSLSSISSTLMDNVNELTKGKDALRQTTSATRKLATIASELLSIRKGEASYDQKRLNSLKDEAKRKIAILELQKRNFQLSADESKTIEENISKSYEMLESFEKIKKTHDETNKKLGAAVHLAKGLDKVLGNIGLNMGIADAVDETQRLAQEAASIGDKGFKPMATFTKLIGNNLKEALTFTNLLQSSVLLLLAALKAVDDGAGELAKKMNITYTEALGVRKELTDIANASYDTAVNTRGLQETLLAAVDATGARVRLNEKDLVLFTKLREQAGLTNQELYGIQQLATLTNKSFEQTNSELLGSAAKFSAIYKTSVNEKQVLKDVAGASASLKLSLGGSVDKLAQSVVLVRKFGLGLEQAQKISDSLLQFESSIENELSAELLLGKDLNFEKARLLALNGDIAGASAEIAKQVGTSAEFNDMNVIQQEAIAKAAGLTRDELAQSIIDREVLNKLGVAGAKDAQDAYNKLKERGYSEAEITQKLGDKKLSDMLQQQSLQERFNQTVEKLKEIFINVANVLMPIFDIFADIFKIVGPIVGLVGQLVSFMSPILTPLLAIYGVFKGIQIVNKGLVALNSILLAQQQAMATTEGVRLGLGQKILATLGLQDAVLAYQMAREEGMIPLVALREAMEQTILGTLVLQGLTLVGNVAKSILLTIQAGARFVAESATLGAMAAQNTGFIGLIAKGAILLAQAIATAVATIAGASAISLGAAAAIALAAGAAAYAFLKGNDIFSPGEGSTGYGKRTLFGPEGAIQLNNNDDVVAGTDLFKKGNDIAMAGKGALTVNSSPSKNQPDNSGLMLAELRENNRLRKEQMRKDKTVSMLKVQ
jgi:molybdopterin-binding protein